MHSQPSQEFTDALSKTLVVHSSIQVRCLLLYTFLQQHLYPRDCCDRRASMVISSKLAFRRCAALANSQCRTRGETQPRFLQRSDSIIEQIIKPCIMTRIIMFPVSTGRGHSLAVKWRNGKQTRTRALGLGFPNWPSYSGPIVISKNFRVVRG